MWRRKHRGHNELFLWAPCTLMILTIFVKPCKSGNLLESKSLVQFMQAIDPNNMSKFNGDVQVPDHCSDMWLGIKCDMHSLSVIEIRLENLNLGGIVDADSLCKLPSLQILSLATNHIHGVIPESISNCVNLSYLNLSSNMLHGRVPSSLNGLKKLRSMDISNNNLSGPVPQFQQDIELFYPKTMQAETSNITNDKDVEESKVSKALAIKRRKWLTTFLPLLLTLSFFSLFVFFANKRFTESTNEKENKQQVHNSPVRKHQIGREASTNKEGEDPDLVFFGKIYKRFSIDDLLKSAADLHGQNFYSTLYKVKFTDTAIYAVKRLQNLQVSGDDFIRKITWIGNLKHPNLLPLVAFNSSEKEKLLIYEYQNKGSLSTLLSNYVKKKRDFPWRKRLLIMKGIARGLHYTAGESREENAPHGNLKPSNIILSDNEEPLLSEYGIWSFLDSKWTMLCPSNGYRAPEKRLTKEADIYSFGVILLELLTGKIVERGGVNLPKWVKAMVREEWTGEVFDREVRKVGRQWAFPLLNIALKCVSELPERRPNISEVLEKIELVVNSQEDCAALSSPSSAESSQHDYLLIHTIIPETGESPEIC